MLAPSLKQANLSARIGVKSLLGGAGAEFQARGVGAEFEATKPVSQDWGKVVVGRCKMEATKPVRQDWGKVVVGKYWHQVRSNQTSQPGLG